MLPGALHALGYGLRHWPDLGTLRLTFVDFAHATGEERQSIEAINQHGCEITLWLMKDDSIPQALLARESYGSHVYLIFY